MPIPRIIHQSWKTETIPKDWREAVSSVKKYHKGWDYRLWTDAAMDLHVREAHPDFHPVFCGLERQIMRADVFRYILMLDFGGLYCDLDYQFLRPYDYDGAELVLGEEFSVDHGDEHNCLANYIFASAPGHPLWRDMIESLQNNPPRIRDYRDIVPTTGPVFLTRIFRENAAKYEGVRIEEKPVFSPKRFHGRHETTILLNNGVTRGIHLGGGSWKERWSWPYWKGKVLRFTGKFLRLVGLGS